MAWWEWVLAGWLGFNLLVILVVLSQAWSDELTERKAERASQKYGDFENGK